MAFKSSERRNTKYAEADLDIRPIMNLMVVLIPLLLAGAQFVKNTVIEVNLPASKGASSSDTPEPKEEEKKEVTMNLTVAITAKGFYITAKNLPAIANEENDPDQPTIPNLAVQEGEDPYDYMALRAKLKEIKEEIKIKPIADKNRVIITASKDIPYSVYVHTQDAVYGEVVEGEIELLFPQVQVGAVI
jgi:biopolymer transport protein ExbD